MALMPEFPDKCVIVCESVHDVMALEHALKNAGIAVEMIPTPRELTSDCGMALEAGTSELERISQLRGELQLRWHNIFSRGKDGWQPLAPAD